MLEAERRQLRSIIENKSRIILVHTTSGYKYDLLAFHSLSTLNICSLALVKIPDDPFLDGKNEIQVLP